MSQRGRQKGSLNLCDIRDTVTATLPVKPSLSQHPDKGAFITVVLGMRNSFRIIGKCFSRIPERHRYLSKVVPYGSSKGCAELSPCLAIEIRRERGSKKAKETNGQEIGNRKQEQERSHGKEKHKERR